MFPNPCPSNWVNDGMDPYFCGDDLLLPKSASSWKGITGQTTAATGIAFMNQFKPPGFGDSFTFVEAPDDTDCWNAPAFKSGAGRLTSTTGLGVMLFGLGLRRLL